jgi:hypothetical protein
MAYGMKSSLQSYGVIVGFIVLKNSFDYLKGLSAKLQRRDIDVFDAYTMIDNIKSEIQCLKNGSGVEFQRWYDKGKQLTSCMGTEVKMPRVPKIQYNRSNVPADTLLLYYKRSIGITFIGVLLQQLQNHLSADNCWHVSALMNLITSLIDKLVMPPQSNLNHGMTTS